MCVCMCAQSCLTLCDPMDYIPPGSSVHGLFQARILEWFTISYSRGSSQPRDRTSASCVSCTGATWFSQTKAQRVKHLSAMWETWVQSLGQEKECHGQRSLVGYSQWDRKELYGTEQLHSWRTSGNETFRNLSPLEIKQIRLKCQLIEYTL